MLQRRLSTCQTHIITQHARALHLARHFTTAVLFSSSYLVQKRATKIMCIIWMYLYVGEANGLNGDRSAVCGAVWVLTVNLWTRSLFPCDVNSMHIYHIHVFCQVKKKKTRSLWGNYISILIWTTYSVDSDYFCNFVWNLSIKSDPNLQLLFLWAASLHKHLKWDVCVFSIILHICLSASMVLYTWWQCELSCLYIKPTFYPTECSSSLYLHDSSLFIRDCVFL